MISIEIYNQTKMYFNGILGVCKVNTMIIQHTTFDHVSTIPRDLPGQ